MKTEYKIITDIIEKNSSILDVGCDDGTLMEFLKANKILSKSEGVSVIDHRKDEGYVTPVEIAGEDKVYISRIRNDQSIDNGLNIWVVSDNLRKGAALNAVQIAELIISKYPNSIKT